MNCVNENAKEDWLKVVKNHRKRQKGLPALSTLNTNAGNVEKNIEIFNSIQTNEAPVADAMNGNMSCSLGEAVKMLKENTMYAETITLYYEDLPIDIPVPGHAGGYYSHRLGGWLPDDDSKEVEVDWEYEAPSDEVIEFFFMDPEIRQEYNADAKSDEEFESEIISNLNLLVDKYEDKLMDKFRDDAVNDAQENYDPSDYYESLNKKHQYKVLDDSFDMSLRTIL